MKISPVKYQVGIYPIISGFLVDENRLDLYLVSKNLVFIELKDYINNKWAVCFSGNSLNKRTLSFDYEPCPSERSDEFKRDYRFNGPEEALGYWINARNKIIKEGKWHPVDGKDWLIK